jgi:AraC-like DNA-binding protein
MAKAAELVKDSILSIKGIAIDSGYNDLSNFYRDFKHVHGMSPLQLRAKHLASQRQQGVVAIYLPVSPREP